MDWTFRAYQITLAALILIAGLWCIFGPLPKNRQITYPMTHRLARVIIGLGIIVTMGLAWLALTTNVLE